MQFSFWPDGRCLLTDVKSELRASPDAISGPALCPEHRGEEPFAATAKTTAAKLRGRGADGGFGPKGPWQDYDPYDPPDNDGLNRRLGNGPGQESKAPAPEARKIASEATAKAGAAHPSQSNDDDGFGPKGPWQDYAPYDPPDNDGLSRRLGSGPGHDQESKAPEPEAQKITSEATAKAGAAHPSQSNDDDGFGPKGPWQDYDPYDPPDNDGLSRRSGSGPGHDQESKAPEPEAQKITSEATAKAGAAHPSQSNDDDGFGPKGPWQDYDPYDPPDNDGLSRRSGSGPGHDQESKAPEPEAQKIASEATAKAGAAHPSQSNDDDGFGPKGPWQDYDPYDPPDNDGLSRRLGSGPGHDQESKAPEPEAQKITSEATAKAGAAHPSQSNADDGFGPKGPWQDYDPYDPPDNDGLSRRLGSGPGHDQESKAPEPEAQKITSEATAKAGAAHPSQSNDDDGFGPKGPWQDYDPYDPPDNDGLSRRLGSGPGHDQESKAPAPEAQKIASEATAKAGAAHPSQSNDDDGFGPKGPWQDYDPYDPPDNDGLSRRSGSGPGHDQESKAPEPEAQKITSEATAKAGAAHPSQSNADDGFGPKGPWQDYDPYDPPDNDGLSRRSGSGPGHDQESKAPEPEAQKITSEATAKAGAAHPSQSNDDDGFGPKGPWQDYDPYDPPDNDGLSRRLGSGPGHDQESKAPEPEAQKITSEATAKAGAAHPSQSNDDDGFGPKGPWQDYDPYDPPDNDGLSRRSGSGPGHDQESKAPEPEAQKIASEATAKAGAAHPSQSNADDGFGPKGPWQDYDPYDPPDNDGLSRRSGSGPGHDQESKAPEPEAQKIASEATAKAGAAHPSQSNADDGFGPKGPWQDYDPYDPPDNDGLSRRSGSGPGHDQESKAPEPEAQKIASEATAKAGAAHPSQSNADDGFGPKGP